MRGENTANWALNWDKTKGVWTALSKERQLQHIFLPFELLQLEDKTAPQSTLFFEIHFRADLKHPVVELHSDLVVFTNVRKLLV